MAPERSGPVDVLVVGGGPAGTTLAILLARRGYSVVLLERGRYQQARAGETFGGELIPLLQEAGLWDHLQNVPRTPFRGVRSSWGGGDQIERASLFHPFGEGWHVDRVAFDAALADAAVRAGVSVRTGSHVAAVERVGNTWSARLTVRPELSKGSAEASIPQPERLLNGNDPPTVRPEVSKGHPGDSHLSARFLVDASGRGARTLVATLGVARWIQMDRLVAVIGRVTPGGGPVDPVLEMEAVESGWWYSAPQSDGGLLVVHMTDADLIDAGSRAGLAQGFGAAMQSTTHTARRCGGASLDLSPWVARSESGFLFPDRGDNWCAIGDAAMGSDPLAGDGVARAIRSAMDAAPGIAQALATGEIGTAPTSDQDNGLRQRFIEYLEMREHYYLAERRFAQAPFWVRRHPIAWRAAPLFLDPRQSLHWDGAPLARDAIAPVEALLPVHAVGALLKRLRQPTPAHEALAFLRAEAPLEDRRLLVAVQDLIARGIIGCEPRHQHQV